MADQVTIPNIIHDLGESIFWGIQKSFSVALRKVFVKLMLLSKIDKQP